ncbi:MAG: hypothetical protein K8I02_13300, partial [Candidatus Methylomirabilis sp.]|nr:hypothetical protein [Deltaproteobacteria bacterium]
MKPVRSLPLLGLAGLLLAGCPRNDYATDGCSAADAPPVADWWAGDGVRDITFLAFGDSQVYLSGDGSENDGSRKNDRHVQALNVAETLSWGALGVPANLSNVRGVIMAGDITQNDRDARIPDANEYAVFSSTYGLCANRTLIYPMFEGYGNHDYQDWYNLLYPLNEHPVADSVSIRNPYRVGLTATAPGKQGHYAWKWDDVTFINTNLTPSDTVPDLPVETEPPGNRDPRMALTFLQERLAALGP